MYLRVSILPLSKILIFDFGIVPRNWYFFVINNTRKANYWCKSYSKRTSSSFNLNGTCSRLHIHVDHDELLMLALNNYITQLFIHYTAHVVLNNNQPINQSIHIQLG